MNCTEHKGHRRYVGGSRDGDVEHLVSTTPTDFPFTWWYPRTKELYERDLDGGTEAIYRFVGVEERGGPRDLASRGEP